MASERIFLFLSVEAEKLQQLTVLIKGGVLRQKGELGGCLLGRGYIGRSVHLYSNLFVLPDIVKRLWGVRRNTEGEKNNNSCLLFLSVFFFLFSLSLPSRLSHYW